jgi:hypothetical protein
MILMWDGPDVQALESYTGSNAVQRSALRAQSGTPAWKLICMDACLSLRMIVRRQTRGSSDRIPLGLDIRWSPLHSGPRYYDSWGLCSADILLGLKEHMTSEVAD